VCVMPSAHHQPKKIMFASTKKGCKYFYRYAIYIYIFIIVSITLGVCVFIWAYREDIRTTSKQQHCNFLRMYVRVVCIIRTTTTTVVAVSINLL
jgi:hypothetical protein